MQRLLMKELIKWKEKENKNPLIVKGVRQCGKTYLLKEFGEKNYVDVAYFNFEANRSLSTIFEQDLDIKRIIIELGVIRGKAIDSCNTLIIFDEIQYCNEALTSLKYFSENTEKYDVVSAGSLLGIALSRPLSFPVGKVDFLTLRPMNMLEFIIANGANMEAEYILGLEKMDKISIAINDKMSTLLRIYYVTGGMPEVVSEWIRTKDIKKVEVIQQKILDSYELDFAKHAPAKEFPKLSAIWRAIPDQLAKENSKFIFSQVKSGSRAKDLEDSLEWLISAGLVYKVCKIEKPFMPLSAYADQTFFKLYMADIGLLRKMANLDASSILYGGEKYKEFKGALVENYALCELINLQNRALYYWKSKNTAEVDFITQFGNHIVPIEVKSEKNDRAKSLAVYRKLYEPDVSVIASMNLLSGIGIRNIPLWLIGRMGDLI
jgi:predicted AAA+ superfamily ATPase